MSSLSNNKANQSIHKFLKSELSTKASLEEIIQAIERNSKNYNQEISNKSLSKTLKTLNLSLCFVSQSMIERLKSQVLIKEEKINEMYNSLKQIDSAMLRALMSEQNLFKFNQSSLRHFLREDSILALEEVLLVNLTLAHTRQAWLPGVHEVATNYGVYSQKFLQQLKRPATKAERTCLISKNTIHNQEEAYAVVLHSRENHIHNFRKTFGYIPEINDLLSLTDANSFLKPSEPVLCSADLGGYIVKEAILTEKYKSLVCQKSNKLDASLLEPGMKIAWISKEMMESLSHYEQGLLKIKKINNRDKVVALIDQNNSPQELSSLLKSLNPLSDGGFVLETEEIVKKIQLSQIDKKEVVRKINSLHLLNLLLKFSRTVFYPETSPIGEFNPQYKKLIDQELSHWFKVHEQKLQSTEELFHF